MIGCCSLAIPMHKYLRRTCKTMFGCLNTQRSNISIKQAGWLLLLYIRNHTLIKTVAQAVPYVSNFVSHILLHKNT